MNTSEYFNQKAELCRKNDAVSADLYQEYGVNRGLRDERGRGVLTGLTNISEITAFQKVNGEKVPADGKLLYRGINIKDLVNGGKGQRFVFELI